MKLTVPEGAPSIRASDALEKVCRDRPSLLQPHVAMLLGAMSRIDQPSVQWHVALMLGHVHLTARQRARAARILRGNLNESSDWIVLNWSLETLAVLARDDARPRRSALARARRRGETP